VIIIKQLKLYEENFKYGYLDCESGATVIPPIYDNGKEYPIEIENVNYMAVMKQNLWGIINCHNETVVDFNYADIGRPRLERGIPKFILCFQQNEEGGHFKIGIISSKLIITVQPILDRFPENIAVLGENTCWYYITQGNKWGAVKNDGTVLMDTVFTKEEVYNKVSEICKQLIVDYHERSNDDNWLKKAMLSKEYCELFEWD
jgi:hypothetical protein